MAAKQHVFEVEQYFSMYPQVHDERLMTAIRVEARLRRNMPQPAAPAGKEKQQGPAPLSKDMRIIEN